MREIDIKVFGLPSELHEFVRVDYSLAQALLVEKTKAHLLPAALTPEQHSLVNGVEVATQEYFAVKMHRLGIPENLISPLPNVQYAISQPDGKSRGDYNSAHDMPVVYVDGFIANGSRNFFDVLSTIVHELGHASVNQELRFYFSEDPEGFEGIIPAIGLEAIGNRKLKATGIEEGMVLFDEVDFFNTYLKKMFPKEYAKRYKWSKGSFVVDHVARLLNLPIEYTSLTPFLRESGHAFPIIGDFFQKTLINSLTMFKEYMFTKKLCEIVGRNSVGQGEKIDAEEAIQYGHDILDRDRYIRSHQAHRAIVHALGGKNAKAIFQLKAHDKEHIDEAMKILMGTDGENAV